MSFIADVYEALEALVAVKGLDVEAGALPTAVAALSDSEVEQLLSCAADLRRCVDRVSVIAAGVVASRSARERGDGGMAAVRGHRSPVGMIQAITGGSAADARRAVSVGASLLDEDGAGSSRSGVGTSDAATPDAGGSDAGGSGAGMPVAPALPPVWHAPLRAALLGGGISSDQHDAIRRGLGEPPAIDGDTSAAAVEVWSIAAEQLMGEACALPVEELAKRARTVRDQLDPAGAEQRFAARFEKRSHRKWTDPDGTHHSHIIYDDEGFAAVCALEDAALRPRRGGPRFVSAEEQAAAAALVDDPRSNEQLSYDLLMSVIRAGMLATASDVFGAKQPGVRLVVVADGTGPRDAFGRMLATGHTEDRGLALPGSVIDRAICDTGTREIGIDTRGNPLYVGREQRLFTPKQRIALATRDGGCLIPGCTTPASYCEAHHCDEWTAHHGRTDIDRGVLLCRFHHLQLHHRGWKINRDTSGRFLLDRRGDGPPVELQSKSAARWAWNPPPGGRRGWRTPPQPARTSAVATT
ncbi:HNH endonuclease signature motif containing protein [Microbacterium awajiense]|uniref:HNH endonuclease signature motif containing protein n=1 Tax=Microbacterium awajiense TaxID=415214 RepID=A0ABP7A0H5_9MICO